MAKGTSKTGCGRLNCIDPNCDGGCDYRADLHGGDMTYLGGDEMYGRHGVYSATDYLAATSFDADGNVVDKSSGGGGDTKCDFCDNGMVERDGIRFPCPRCNTI